MFGKVLLGLGNWAAMQCTRRIPLTFCLHIQQHSKREIVQPFSQHHGWALTKMGIKEEVEELKAEVEEPEEEDLEEIQANISTLKSYLKP